MWTSEMAKLREKGQTIFSNGTSPTNAESNQRVQPKEGSSTGLVTAFSRFMPINSPVVLCSEASLSMLVDCFSAWKLWCNATLSFAFFALFVFGPSLMKRAKKMCKYWAWNFNKNIYGLKMEIWIPNHKIEKEKERINFVPIGKSVSCLRWLGLIKPSKRTKFLFEVPGRWCQYCPICHDVTLGQSLTSSLCWSEVSHF